MLNFKSMPKTAVAFAVKNHIRLGQWVGHKDNLFHIFDENRAIVEVSHFSTAKSAILMMKRYLKQKL